MKLFHKLLGVLLVASLFAACDKKDSVNTFANGNAPLLESSSLVVAPAASDSLNTVLTLRWTDPMYKNNMATKYTVQIDSVGKNFSNPYTRVVTDGNTSAFIGKALNQFLLDRGYAYNVPVSMEARLVSSYPNNNEPLYSNVLPIRMTPYKTPPRVALPTTGHVYIVGDATQGGWNNPVPVPTQEFSQIDATTYAGIFQLNANKQYLLLVSNGDWSRKFAISDQGVPNVATQGIFGYHQDGQAQPDIYTQNFLGPTNAGTYKIVLDFQTGTYKVTPYTAAPLPTNLYIVGDATNGGWTNPVPIPTQQFTQVNSAEWKIALPFNTDKQFLVLTNNGDWSKKFAIADQGVAGVRTAGQFGYHQDGQPSPDVFTQNFLGPLTGGNYTLTLNFAAPTTVAGAAGTYTVQ